MQALNLDQAGEFLSIAATLVWIKSRSLLPREAQAEDEPDPETLEEMLLLRLQEYQRFKEASLQLAERDLLGRELFARRPAPDPDDPAPEGPQFEDVSLFALLEAFRHALERVRNLSELHIIPERARVEDKVNALLARLAGAGPVFLHDCFAEAEDRGEVILTFIAMLELVRLQALRITQATSGAPILCTPTEALRADDPEFRRTLLVSIHGEALPEEEPTAPPVTDDAPAAGNGGGAS